MPRPRRAPPQPDEGAVGAARSGESIVSPGSSEAVARAHDKTCLAPCMVAWRTRCRDRISGSNDFHRLASSSPTYPPLPTYTLCGICNPCAHHDRVAQDDPPPRRARLCSWITRSYWHPPAVSLRALRGLSFSIAPEPPPGLAVAYAATTCTMRASPTQCLFRPERPR